MRQTASFISSFVLGLAAPLALTLSVGLTAASAAALTGQSDAAGFVRGLARDSARIALAPDLGEEQRVDALRRLTRRNVDHNRLSRFLVRTTPATGEADQAVLLDEAQQTAVARFSALLNDPAIGRLYPSKVALLPNGLAMVETRIDYDDAPSRVWSWQLTRMQGPNGSVVWGLLDIVAEERQSVALAARRFIKDRLHEMAEAQPQNAALREPGLPVGDDVAGTRVGLPSSAPTGAAVSAH